MQLQTLGSGHQYGGGRRDTSSSAFDVQKFLGTQIRTETSFCYGVFPVLKSGPSGHDAVTAMGDVGKRTSVYKRGATFQGLDQVGFDGVFQQNQNRASGTQVFHGKGGSIVAVAQQDRIDAVAQIFQAGTQTQNRHDFRGGGDIKSGFCRDAIGRSAHARIDHAQTAVVHIHYTAPQDSLQTVGCALVVVMVVVEQCCNGIVRRSDGMEITSKVQVDILHGQYLRVSSTGRAPFHAETRSERWLTQRHNGFLADVVKSLRQSHGCGCFSATALVGGSCGNQNQFALLDAFLVGYEIYFGFVLAILFDVLCVDVVLSGNHLDALQLRLLCNFNVC